MSQKYPDFNAWMRDVNKAVEAKCGLSSDDLPDVCYMDMYEDGYTPKQAAAEAFRNAE